MPSEETPTQPQSCPPVTEHEALYSWIRERTGTGDGMSEIAADIDEAIEIAENLGTLEKIRLASLARTCLLSAQVNYLRDSLNETVYEAREWDTTWSAIGQAVGITMQAAHRRWDPGAKRRHREYQLSRYSPVKSVRQGD